MEPEKKSNGALVGLVIIIVILVIGATYILILNRKTKELQNTPTESESVTEQDESALNTLEQDANVIDTDTGIDVNTVN